MTPDLIKELFEIVLIPLFGALTTFAVKWINAKTNQVKAKTDNEILQQYIDMLARTVSDCVVATNQTYVDSLKRQGNFTKEAQEKAFEETYNAVITILSDDAKEFLGSSVGDLEVYITKLIEASVSVEKTEMPETTEQ